MKISSDVMSSKSKSVSKEEEDELSRGGTDLSLFTKSAASLTYTTKSGLSFRQRACKIGL